MNVETSLAPDTLHVMPVSAFVHRSTNLHNDKKYYIAYYVGTILLLLMIYDTKIFSDSLRKYQLAQ